MKKMLKSLLAVVLVVAICFAFAGCKIVVVDGEWTCNKMRATVSYTNAEVDLLQFGGNLELVLNDDESMTIKGFIPPAYPFDGYYANINDSGKWSLDGETVTLDGTDKYTLTWDNNKLVLEITKEYADPAEMVGGKAATLTIRCEFVPKTEK